MQQAFRRILPQVSAPPNGADAPEPPPKEPAANIRRVRTRVACDSCRMKKYACNGQRPSCSMCLRKNTACSYISTDGNETSSMVHRRKIAEARSVIRDYEGFIRHLQSVPESEALASLRRLRSAPSTEAFLSGEAHDRSTAPMSATSGGGAHRDGNIQSDESQSGLLAEGHSHRVYQQHRSIDPSLPPLQERALWDSSSSHELAEARANNTAEVHQQTLQRLRFDNNPQPVVDFLRGNIQINNRPSELRTALSVTPPVQSPYGLQLMLQHPGTYPRLDLVGRSQSKGIPSELLTAHTTPRQGQESSSSVLQQSRVMSWRKPSTSEAQPIMTHSAANSNSIFGPARLPEYFDSCLASLEIQFWTTVPVDNSFAAEVISLYLDTDHPVLGLFEPTAFLTALVQKNINVCSAFEVNALLACASNSYSVNSPLAASYSYQFQDEAERLRRGERTTDSIANIVGLAYLFLFHGAHGQGELAQARLQELAEMAKRMGLFGTAKLKGLKDLGDLPLDLQEAAAYAAWGAFNLISMQSLFWAVDYSEYPPILPIPGRYTSSTDESNGPQLTEIPLPPVMGNTFTAFCELWSIAADVLIVYNLVHDQNKASLAFALSKYQKILDWADKLPATMAHNETAHGHVLVFHIWLHAYILHIFRPFISEAKQHDLNLWNPSSTAPEAIFSASVEQLKDLILLYRRTHVSSPKSMLWNVALIYVANAVLKNTSNPQWRFYFMLCIYTYRDIAPCFPVAKKIAQGLLALAMDNGVITSDEAVLYISDFRAEIPPEAEEKYQAGFVLDLDLAVQDKEAAQVDVLVDKFDTMVLFSQWTNDIV